MSLFGSLFVVWLIILAVGIVFALVSRDRPDWLFGLFASVAVIAIALGFVCGYGYLSNLKNISWDNNQDVSIIGFMVGIICIGCALYVKDNLIDKNKKDK